MRGTPEESAAAALVPHHSPTAPLRFAPRRGAPPRASRRRVNPHRSAVRSSPGFRPPPSSRSSGALDPDAAWAAYQLLTPQMQEIVAAHVNSAWPPFGVNCSPARSAIKRSNAVSSASAIV